MLIYGELYIIHQLSLKNKGRRKKERKKEIRKDRKKTERKERRKKEEKIKIQNLMCLVLFLDTSKPPTCKY